ncbi:uncharacterized protein ACIB01_011257 [Guaruba guarouba]
MECPYGSREGATSAGPWSFRLEAHHPAALRGSGYCLDVSAAERLNLRPALGFHEFKMHQLLTPFSLTALKQICHGIKKFHATTKGFELITWKACRRNITW